MSSKSPRPLGEILASGGLGRLGAAAGRQAGLTECLKAALPPALKDGLRACNLREDGTLVISAASPEWAARLRYEADSLLKACRAGHGPAERVRVRVGTNRP